MLQIQNVTLVGLKEIAKKIIAEFHKEKIFLMQGEMGSGKTTFIKCLCETLGVEEIVTSPSFALINEYKTSDKNTVYHFDFYRINTQTEAFDFGYEEYFYSGNYCLIEWPEKIETLLPDHFIKINIDINNDGSRNFIVQEYNLLLK